jgi:hypothetical protein
MYFVRRKVCFAYFYYAGRLRRLRDCQSTRIERTRSPSSYAGAWGWPSLDQVNVSELRQDNLLDTVPRARRTMPISSFYHLDPFLRQDVIEIKIIHITLTPFPVAE